MRLYDIVACPLCSAALECRGTSAVCTNGHCYDIASTGYVNLLPPGKGRNARTGDDKGMIRARTEFLSLGLYDGISDHVADTILDHSNHLSSISLIDAGCGEGYHTSRISARLGASGAHRTVTALGIDASKNGASAGAKRASRLSLGGSFKDSFENDVSVYFAAGSIFAMPAGDKSADVILSMFAPIPGDEAQRVLSDDGILVVVAAGDDHLYELRELLYDEPRLGDGSVSQINGFDMIDHRSLKYKAHVPDNAALQALFTMTPFYYRTNEAGRERLARCESLDITVSTEVYVFAKSK